MVLSARTLNRVSGGVIDGIGRCPMVYAENTSTILGSTTTSTAVWTFDAAGLDEIALQFLNNGSTTCTVKIFGSPAKDMPTTTTAALWKQIGSSITITTGAMSEPQVFDNPYMWVMVTGIPVGAETLTLDAYLNAYLHP